MPARALEPTPPSQTLSRSRAALLALLAMCIGLLAAVLLAELALRIRNGGDFHIQDLRPVPWGISEEGFAEYDPLLGWVPRAHATNTWPGGWSASIDGDRLRRNGSTAVVLREDLPPILAVGDSTAFGDEVGDDGSWPAHLEQRLGRRVQNAGVGGYGIDQAVLRAERRLDRDQLAAVVLSFVSDDVTRCAYSFRNRWRPYFSLTDGRLVLTPPPSPDVPLPESPLLVALGHSHLGRLVLERTYPEVWNRSTHRRVHHDELEVSARMLARLQRHVDSLGSRLLVVGLAGGDGDRQYVPALLARGEAEGVATLDLTDQLVKWATDPLERDRRFRPHYHLASATNDWVAERIAARLEELGWVSAAPAS